MYLSRLQLNPAHPQARRDLASAYELHRSLARAFAPDAATPPPGSCGGAKPTTPACPARPCWCRPRRQRRGIRCTRPRKSARDTS